MNKLTIDQVELKNKRVLVRVDFNVPLDGDVVTDDIRIRESLPTIQKIIDSGGKAILMSHLGRPKGKKTAEFSLAPAARKLAELLGKPVVMASDCIGPEVEQAVSKLPAGGVILLENLRFYAEEEKNDPGFAEKLAKLGDLYVNDAFGSAHRAHASTEGVTKFIKPAVAGYLMQKELKTHRKYQQKNDGQWQMYRVKLKDPAEKLDIEIANIRKLPDGKVGLDVTALASLEVFGRQSQWEHGIQLYSLSAEADARVRLWASVEVATHVDWSRLPPDVALDPQVTAAKFEIPDFRMRRIGQFEGPIVRSLSHSIREVLEEKLTDDNQKLVAKLNRAIDKQEKKLKLSLADVMKSKWKWLVGDDEKSN